MKTSPIGKCFSVHEKKLVSSKTEPNFPICMMIIIFHINKLPDVVIKK